MSWRSEKEKKRPFGQQMTELKEAGSPGQWWGQTCEEKHCSAQAWSLADGPPGSGTQSSKQGTAR